VSTLHQRAKGAHEGFWSSPQEPEGSLTAIQNLFFQAENVPPHRHPPFVDEGRTARPVRPSNPASRFMRRPWLRRPLCMIRWSPT